jgi:hypothetical protein
MSRVWNWLSKLQMVGLTDYRRGALAMSIQGRRLRLRRGNALRRRIRLRFLITKKGEGLNRLKLLIPKRQILAVNRQKGVLH